MRLGIRGKLFVGALAVIALVVVAGGLYLEPSLRSWLERRVEQELTRHARTARVAVEARPRLEPGAGRGERAGLGRPAVDQRQERADEARRAGMDGERRGGAGS